MPAIALADGSITSPFLALFGRSASRNGDGERARQQTDAGSVAALAQFQPYPTQAGTGAKLKSDRGGAAETAGNG